MEDDQLWAGGQEQSNSDGSGDDNYDTSDMTEADLQQMLEYRQQLMHQLEEQRALQQQLEQLQELRSQLENQSAEGTHDTTEMPDNFSRDPTGSTSLQLESKAESEFFFCHPAVVCVDMICLPRNTKVAVKSAHLQTPLRQTIMSNTLARAALTKQVMRSRASKLVTAAATETSP
jgi:hypothetical protein